MPIQSLCAVSGLTKPCRFLGLNRPAELPWLYYEGNAQPDHAELLLARIADDKMQLKLATIALNGTVLAVADLTTQLQVREVSLPCACAPLLRVALAQPPAVFFGPHFLCLLFALLQLGCRAATSAFLSLANNYDAGACSIDLTQYPTTGKRGNARRCCCTSP